jgi:hypothetical protein
MGILSDAIVAFAGVSSGQSSAQEAVGSLGLSGEQHDRMVDLFEAEERSLRSSGTLSADLNSVQSRERRALLDAQVAYHNDLQSHLESVNDLNADNWNKAQDRWVDIRTSLDKRDTDLTKARSNVNQAAINQIRRDGGSSVAGQWTQLTGYLGIDGKALNDTQLYSTIETWRSLNPNFLPENWQTASNEAIQNHLIGQQMTAGQVTAVMNSVSRAKSTYSQIVIAEDQVAQTRATLDALQAGGGDFDTTETQAQLNKLRGQLDQMLVEGDPTTGLTAQDAIQQQGAMLKGFELLDEQEAFRARLNAASPSERSTVNNGIAALLAKPEFQQWAKDNGIPIGISRDGRYVPRSTDHLAVLAFRREELRGMHRYGGSGGRTGEVLEIRVGGAPVQMYNVDGTMMTQAQAQAQYPDQTVSVNESGQLTITIAEDPIDGMYPTTDLKPRVFEKGPMTATETVVVERARANAARMMQDPGKIEVFMPDGTIRVIEPDDVVQTIRDPSTEASMSEQQRRDSRMRGRSRLWNRLVNSGLIDQLDDEDYMIEQNIDAGTMSRRDARRAERAALDMTDAEREAQARLDSVGADVSTLPEEDAPVDISDEAQDVETLEQLEDERISASERAQARDVDPQSPQVFTSAADQPHIIPAGQGRFIRRGNYDEDGVWVPGLRDSDGNFLYEIHAVPGLDWEEMGSNTWQANITSDMAQYGTVQSRFPATLEPEPAAELEPEGPRVARTTTLVYHGQDVPLEQNSDGSFTFYPDPEGEGTNVPARDAEGQLNPAWNNLQTRTEDFSWEGDNPLSAQDLEIMRAPVPVGTPPGSPFELPGVPDISPPPAPEPAVSRSVSPPPAGEYSAEVKPQTKIPTTPKDDLQLEMPAPIAEPELGKIPTMDKEAEEDRQSRRRLMNMFDRETPLFQRLRNRGNADDVKRNK